MTVSYQYDVASSSTGGFFRLLWRWRGSIWKLLYKELLLFVAVYICIAFTYDFLMSDYYKRYYEHIVIFCSAFVEVIPLSFILGFYVSFTAHRWWQQYTAIPWPDKLMNIIALYIPGNDVTSRVLRRTLMRYLNLTLVLVLRSISIPVKRRFPTKEHLVEAGFMSRPELEIYQSVPSHEFNTFWIPCTWFVNLLREAKSECRITDSGGIKLIMEEFNEFRSKCGLLWSYDWVSIPLVYTQVVTLSTQAFFLASLLGRQHINSSEEIKSHIYGEYYIPIFTMLQFILYMGLLKLGEQLINPFGDDDEDFELNWIIDRHLKVSFLGVDILNSDPPPLIKDNYFDDMDIKLPYTEAAVAHKVKTYRGSVAAFHVPTEKHGLVIPEFEDENDEDTDDEPSTIQSNRDAVARNNSWSLFSQRKRKLSSSFDSFNSELMVETGLSESEIPELVPTNSSWPTFLKSEQQRTSNKNDNNRQTSSSLSKLSVWPMNKLLNEKANEDTQGIRWNENGKQLQEQSGGSNSNNNDNNQQSQQQSNKGQKDCLFKQSSLSTSDSSIAIPLGETPNQWNTSSTATKFFKPRKHPLQVFSKELANAPISVFNQILESNLRRESKNSGERSSMSSLSSSKTEQSRSFKPYKSLIKCQRPVDPKLRIRPFRSKVTFSDDTKTDDNSLRIRGSGRTFPYNYYDSSSESNSSLMRTQQEEQTQSKRTRTSPRRVILEPKSPKNSHSELSFAENSKRRQSLDPTLYQRDKQNLVEEVDKDNWLHYQSLPNIQEEDLQPLSQLESGTALVCSTFTFAPPKSLNTSLEIHCHQPQPPPPIALSTFSTVSSASHPSAPLSPLLKTVIPMTNLNPLQQQQSNVLLSPETSTTSTHAASTRKRSFKRQKSQEIPDEDLKARLSQPTTNRKMIKQSSDDSQASSNSSTKGVIVPPGILRKRNENPKQASTESDTGSYHTVKSLVMHASSSIDSFTSAVSDPIQNNSNNINNNNQNQHNGTNLIIAHPKEEHTHHPSTTLKLTENRLLLYPTIESALVPKIVFSQSTPSVTSQSSDDQNSPKWDERYSEFSSMETVVHTTDQNTTLRHDNKKSFSENDQQHQTTIGRYNNVKRSLTTTIPTINVSRDDSCKSTKQLQHSQSTKPSSTSSSSPRTALSSKGSIKR